MRSLNTWYHVAGVYDAATATLDIYVNGALDNGVLRGTVPASQFNPAHEREHRPAHAAASTSSGRIDEVRIYNRALSAAEIQADMNTPVTSDAGHAGADGADRA